MKKILTIIGIVSLMTTGAFAQGTVLFSNNNSSLVTLESDGSALPVSDDLLLALYWAPLGTTDVNAFTQLGAATTIRPIAGRYSGGERVTGLGTAPGAQANFMVKAWSTAMGATYEEALTSGIIGLVGFSDIFTSATGGAGDPAGPAVSLANSALGFSVAVVPEPSVIALAILGGGLLLFRRKK